MAASPSSLPSHGSSSTHDSQLTDTQTHTHMTNDTPFVFATTCHIFPLFSDFTPAQIHLFGSIHQIIMAPFLTKKVKQTKDEAADPDTQTPATTASVPVTIEAAPRQASDNASLIPLTGSIGNQAGFPESPRSPSKVKSFLLATFGCFFADGASVYGGDGDNARSSRPVSGIIPLGPQARTAGAANGSGHGGNYITPYTSVREPNRNSSNGNEGTTGRAIGSPDPGTVRRPATSRGGGGGSYRNAVYIPEAPPRSYRRGIPGELLEIESDVRGKAASGDAMKKCKLNLCLLCLIHCLYAICFMLFLTVFIWLTLI